MKMIFQRAKINSAYWILFLVLIGSFSSFTFFLIEHQREVLMQRETTNLEQELMMANEFIREDLAMEEYQHIEQFFQLWANNNSKIVSIKVVAQNGFVIAKFHKDKLPDTYMRLNQHIKNGVSIDLQVVFDLSDIEKELDSLLSLMVLAIIFFTLFLMLLLWGLLNVCLVKPLRHSENKFITMAAIDPLTKVNNRRSFYDIVAREMSNCRQQQNALSMIYFDLDFFKKINDNYGHHIGDLILYLVATTIRTILREGDEIGRLGGEEFAICLPKMKSEKAKQTAERIRSAVAALPPLEGKEALNINISIGLAEMQDDDSVDSLINRCDSALYKAKQAGRNCIVLAPPNS